jgi:hypothetical protein
MVGLAEEVPSSLLLELSSWVQIPSVTQFFTARISPSLASTGLIDTVVPEWEQAAPTAMAHT